MFFWIYMFLQNTFFVGMILYYQWTWVHKYGIDWNIPGISLILYIYLGSIGVCIYGAFFMNKKKYKGGGVWEV